MESFQISTLSPTEKGTHNTTAKAAGKSGAFSREKRAPLTAEARSLLARPRLSPVLRSRPPGPPHARRPCGNCFALRAIKHTPLPPSRNPAGAGRALLVRSSLPRAGRALSEPRRRWRPLSPLRSGQTDVRWLCPCALQASPHLFTPSCRLGPSAHALTFADFPLSSGREETPGARACQRPGGTKLLRMLDGAARDSTGRAESFRSGVCCQQTVVMGNV